MDIDGQVIENEGQEPTFYARIPNMAIDDLDPYELALYCNYKRTASESGKCYKSNATLAQETGMSVSKVKDVRSKLQGKGYIRVKHHPVKSEKGNKVETIPPTVTIINIWEKNHNRYRKPTENQPNTPSPENHPPQVSGDYPPSPENHKEDYLKKNRGEEESAAPHAQGDSKPNLPLTPNAAPPLPPNYRAFENSFKPLPAILEAWHDAHPIIKPTIPRNQRDRYIEEADALIEAGITPQDMTAFIRERLQNGQKTTWAFVITDIHDFMRERNRTSPAAATPKYYEPEPVRAALTPEQIAAIKREVQNGE